MLRTFLCALIGATCVVASLSGCASDPNPTEVMSQVHVGMTKDEVIDRLGPPDGNWGPWHSQCIEYGFKKYAMDRYAIYINNKDRVIFTEHAGCSVARAEQLGLR
jgi:hypothetical protein